ncbi:hypothetical protein G6O67_001241 [Ophiocordyceps sinensis]|uniref:Uncharacterized protein n=2 Tax=Ophiocordyceps sinensis TaxID=72228 RepID=A0A8H4V8L1_9HYPO|nr:hypothetical protein OCS_03540 [Ophiocordyceps sinensis CO18]KAF4512057.1 hypothetical protein G6O67_001241 [Ophiocordyceps sinensis]
MGQSLFGRIQAKLELFRLEQRYTRHRNRRSTFVSNAIYVDGEYIYQVPNSTGSSTDSRSSRVDALHGDKAVAGAAAQNNGSMMTVAEAVQSPPPERKRLNRFSSMPGFGNTFGKDRRQVIERQTSILR